MGVDGRGRNGAGVDSNSEDLGGLMDLRVLFHALWTANCWGRRHGTRHHIVVEVLIAARVVPPALMTGPSKRKYPCLRIRRGRGIVHDHVPGA